LRQNERLKNYNSQITERMQERDEDLAASYEKNARKDRTITKLAIAVVALGALILALLALGLTGRLKP
jgi:hypothetical protein